MKKNLIKILAVITACVILAGCSNTASDSYYSPSIEPQTSNTFKTNPATAGGDYSGSFETAERASGEFGANPATGGSGDVLGSNALPEQEYEIKIIKNANINAESMDFDKALEQLEAYIKENGGYISNRSVYGSSYYSYDAYERNLDMTIRIPAEKFDEFLSGMSEYINITYTNEYQEDVTDHYYDLDARKNSLLLQEERYLAILAKSTEISDIITIEAALEDVRYQIENITGMLSRLEGQISYSYINLSLREVSKLNVVNTAPKTFGEKLALAFQSSFIKLGNTLENTLFDVIENGPLFILNLAFLVLLIWVASKIIKKFFPGFIVRFNLKGRTKREEIAEAEKENPSENKPQ